MYQKFWIRYCYFIKREDIRFNKNSSKCCLFTSINLDDSAENIDFSSKTDTADETDATCLPEPFSSLFDSAAVNLGNDDLTSLCKDIYSQYHQAYRQKSYDNLTKVTILQSLNYNWNFHRGGRIKASNFHWVRHKKVDDEGNQNTSSLLNELILYTITPNVPAITHGQKNEKRAWTQYKTLSLQEHQILVIQNTGLHINAEFPYLGASPDGLSQCDCHGKGVLEIKCPRNYRYGLKNWQQDKNFFIDELSNKDWPQVLLSNSRSDVYIKLGFLWLLHLVTCYFYRLSKFPKNSCWEQHVC